MKSAFLIISLSFLPSFFVFASENNSNQSCYTATTQTWGSVPANFCLDSVHLEKNNELLMISGKDSMMPASLKIKSISHISDKKNQFVAESVISNEWNSWCGHGERVTLTIRGIAENEIINSDKLGITVDYFSTFDTCHVQAESELIVYTLRK